MENVTLSGAAAPEYLGEVSIGLAEGRTLAVIGERECVGALCKIIAGIKTPAGGTVSVFGEPMSLGSREHMGYIYDGMPFAAALTAQDIDRFMALTYKKWNSRAFFGYCFSFSIAKKKVIKELNAVMQRKLFLAAAMSHSTILLVIDGAFVSAGGIDADTRRVFGDFLGRNEKRSAVLGVSSVSEVKQLADGFVFLSKNHPPFAVSKEELETEWLIDKREKREFESEYKSVSPLARAEGDEVSFLMRRDAAGKNRARAPDIEDVEALLRGTGR